VLLDSAGAIEDDARPMRIAFASRHLTLVGGGESYQRQVIGALAARGHAISVLHEEPGIGETIVPPGVEVVTWNARASREEALRALRAWRADVLFVHGLADAALEERLTGELPSALFAHGYYGMCVSGTKRHAFPRPVPCSREFGPACLALFLARRCGGLNPLTAATLYRTQSRRRRLLSSYRQICVASEHMRTEVLRYDVEPGRVHRLELPGLPASAPPAVRRCSGRVGFVGRMTEVKGLDLLLEALALLRTARGRSLALDAIGDGPFRARAEGLATRLAVPVAWHGRLAPAARDELVARLDLLVIPSTWPEPWGLVGLEAGRLGVPSVAFAVGGLPEWIEPGVSGELAPGAPPTARGLADAIARALAVPEHLERLRLGAWERSQRSTLEAHVEALEGLLARAAGWR
jgi:glycosyltransferase involved in cell wall biosynthesis